MKSAVKKNEVMEAQVPEIKVKKVKNITLRVPVDLHKAVRQKLAGGDGEDEKWQPLLLGLLRQWLGDEVTPALPELTTRQLDPLS